MKLTVTFEVGGVMHAMNLANQIIALYRQATGIPPIKGDVVYSESNLFDAMNGTPIVAIEVKSNEP